MSAYLHACDRACVRGFILACVRGFILACVRGFILACVRECILACVRECILAYVTTFTVTSSSNLSQPLTDNDGEGRGEYRAVSSPSHRIMYAVYKIFDGIKNIRISFIENVTRGRGFDKSTSVIPRVSGKKLYLN